MRTGQPRLGAGTASANLLLVPSFEDNALQNDAETTTVANSIWRWRRNALKIQSPSEALRTNGDVTTFNRQTCSRESVRAPGDMNFKVCGREILCISGDWFDRLQPQEENFEP